MNCSQTAFLFLLVLTSVAVRGVDKAPNPEEHPIKADECILVFYCSRTGNTERVAKDLVARLHADVERIDDKADRDGIAGYLSALYDSLRKVAADIAKPQKDPANYSLTVVGTPIWAWNMTPAARAYLIDPALAFSCESDSPQSANCVDHHGLTA